MQVLFMSVYHGKSSWLDDLHSTQREDHLWKSQHALCGWHVAIESMTYHERNFLPFGQVQRIEDGNGQYGN